VSEELVDFAKRFHATALSETDSENNVVGVSIVPKIGFSSGGKSMKLEEWFKRYGRNLLVKLVSVLRGVA